MAAPQPDGGPSNANTPHNYSGDFSSGSSSELKLEREKDVVQQEAHRTQTRGSAHSQAEAAAASPGDETKETDPEKSPAAVPPANPMMDPSAFPDGGWQAWLVVLGSFCNMFVSFGWINCIGIFQNYYQSHQLQDMSPSTIAWIPSLETFMMFVGGPVFGKLIDNYGPRYVLLVGSFLHVFGLMMASISTEYYQFILSQGICSPLGASMIFYPSVTCVASWFFRHRALALGISASGSSLGGVIIPIMVQRLVDRVGFGWTMRICAFLILGLLIISNLTLKSRIPPHPKPLRIMEFIRPLSEIPFLLICVAAFMFFFGMFLPFTFIILQARRYGMSPGLAGYLIAILNAASIFGRTIPGYLGDRIGRFNMMVSMTFLSAILVLALWMPSRANAPVIVFAVLYGFSSGAFVSLAPALVAQISDVRQMGVRTGTLFAIVSFAALTGNPIGGALVPDVENGSFEKLQIFSGVVMAVGATLFLAARIYIAGWSLKKIV